MVNKVELPAAVSRKSAQSDKSTLKPGEQCVWPYGCKIIQSVLEK